MTDTEARVRAALHEMAAESQPVPLLTPLMRRRGVERRRRRITIASAVAATAAVITGGVLLGGYHRSDTPQPAQPTVKVVHLSHRSSTQPGPAQMFVTVSRGGPAKVTPYVVPTTTSGAVQFVSKTRMSDTVDKQVLSTDGRFLVQFHDVFCYCASPAVVLTNLATGQERRFAVPQFSWAELSPDGKTLALRAETKVTLIDVATRSARLLPQLTLGASAGAQVGWSPDGRLLAVEDVKDSLIVDLRGRIRTRLSGVSLVNASMSWSPDGQSVLVYDGAHPGVRVTPAAGGPSLELSPPAGAVRALGWTGDRVVWLAGQPGAQRLLTTDVHGGHAATWMKFEVGGRSVGSVSWSRATGG